MSCKHKAVSSFWNEFLCFYRIFITLISASILLLFLPLSANAQLQNIQERSGQTVVRSVESLRDLEYQTWQMVAYPQEDSDDNKVLRIVGYPGTLRFDHPNNLQVKAGLRTWNLKDITLDNEKLSKDPREAAAEFDLTPLLNDLSNNRPLRLLLKDVFTELPVPPFVVQEWRTIEKIQTP